MHTVADTSTLGGPARTHARTRGMGCYAESQEPPLRVLCCTFLCGFERWRSHMRVLGLSAGGRICVCSVGGCMYKEGQDQVAEMRRS